jgi:uncharacterized protein
MRVIAAATLLALATLTANAQAQTVPDCAKAKGPVAEAICADADLRALDTALTRAFTSARARVDRDSLKALEKDQKAFLDERAMVLDRKEMPLKDYMAHRLAFLEGIQSPAWSRDAGAFVGTWRNSLGEVRVTPDETGKLVVGISTLSPAESKWICDIESLAEAPRNGRVTFTEDEVKVTLSRRGSALVIGDQVPEGDGGRPFCGANGYIDGAFFKVK